VNKRQYSIPENLEKNISEALESLGYKLTDSSRLAEAVLRLSDYFITETGSTPWREKWAQAAYLAYFLPLNFVRSQAVIDHGLAKNFFEGFTNVIDFGSGPGTASLALEKIFSKDNFLLIEKAPQAIALAQSYFTPFTFSEKIGRISSGTLGVFSYSLNELDILPEWANQCDGLMLIEPSTQDDGRLLQALRKDLMAQGFQMWAPCTHQQDCPLLIHSKKDWCHDRIFFEPTAWFQKMEEHLPMKNRTLTYSYLLVKKQEPGNKPNVGRLIGDQLNEKGKTRQLFCRSDRREFLAWLQRHGPAPELYRGDLFELPEHEEKSNELRLKV
jgi:ribosomal protein RSM22 (predicted rRNA methylase)